MSSYDRFMLATDRINDDGRFCQICGKKYTLELEIPHYYVSLSVCRIGKKKPFMQCLHLQLWFTSCRDVLLAVLCTRVSPHVKTMSAFPIAAQIPNVTLFGTEIPT